MTIQEVLTSTMKSSSPDTDLAAAAKIMWDGDAARCRLSTKNDE